MESCIGDRELDRWVRGEGRSVRNLTQPIVGETRDKGLEPVNDLGDGDCISEAGLGRGVAGLERVAAKEPI